MKQIYNCVIIDDEPAPRQILAAHIARHPFLGLLKSFDEAPKALEYLKKYRPDLIFLDIDMPMLSGLDLINNLNTEGLSFIFVTAHPQFAKDAFDLDAVDYLSKPVSYERFTQSVKKALRRLEVSKVDSVVLNIGKEYIALEQQSIDWIEADDYCVNVYGRKLVNERLTLRFTLSKLYDLLPHDIFFKINRSVIVSIHFIKSVRNSEVTLKNGKKFVVSRSNKSVLASIEHKLLLQ